MHVIVHDIICVYNIASITESNDMQCRIHFIESVSLTHFVQCL